MSDTALRQLEDIEIVPVVSNPFSNDTDNDYYPDDKDIFVAIANPMYINDAAIDDSYLFSDSTNPKSDDESNWSDGTLTKCSIHSISSDKATESVSGIRFHRKSGIASFTITPEETSFYHYSIEGEGFDSSGLNRFYNIEVTYPLRSMRSPMISLSGNTVKANVQIEEDGTFLLKEGYTYTINVNCSNVMGYDFVISHANWVYAPAGGVLKKYGFKLPEGRVKTESLEVGEILYITPELLYKAATGFSIDNPEALEKTKDEKINDIMKELSYSLPSDSEIYFGEVVSIVGVMVMFVPPYIPVKIAGATTTFAGLGFTLYDKSKIDISKDNEKTLYDYDMNVCCPILNAGTLDFHQICVLSGWENKGYINRINGDWSGYVEPVTYQDVKSGLLFK